MTVKGYQLQGFADTTLEHSYHIHTNRVDPPGQDNSADAVKTRCAKALGHLDPLGLTDNLKCAPLFPQHCQIGDLSGKVGECPWCLLTC